MITCYFNVEIKIFRLVEDASTEGNDTELQNISTDSSLLNTINKLINPDYHQCENNGERNCNSTNSYSKVPSLDQTIIVENKCYEYYCNNKGTAILTFDQNNFDLKGTCTFDIFSVSKNPDGEQIFRYHNQEEDEIYEVNLTDDDLNLPGLTTISFDDLIFQIFFSKSNKF